MAKRTIWIGILLAGFLSLGIQQSSAQVIVSIKPVRPTVKVVKPVKPYVNAAWIEGEWVWNKRTRAYQWKSGYWVKAKRNKRYVTGRWEKRRNGWVYVPGRWVSTKRRIRA